LWKINSFLSKVLSDRTAFVNASSIGRVSVRRRLSSRLDPDRQALGGVTRFSGIVYESNEVKECTEFERIEVVEVKGVRENILSGRSERSGGHRGLSKKAYDFFTCLCSVII